MTVTTRDSRRCLHLEEVSVPARL